MNASLVGMVNVADLVEGLSCDVYVYMNEWMDGWMKRR